MNKAQNNKETSEKLAKQKREKMPIKKRAKQFKPFSAVAGLEEALRQKEWEIESKQQIKYRK